jgi:hypothetical protein
LKRAVDRAETGDDSALPAVRETLADPLAVALIAGDLARLAEVAIINSLTANLPGMREPITRKMEALRAELLGPDPTPVERLLVDRAVACWLQVQEADLRDGLAAVRYEPGLSKYLVGRATAAHRRYLSALKALALVRKLAIPVLRVQLVAPSPAAAVRGRTAARPLARA